MFKSGKLFGVVELLFKFLSVEDLEGLSKEEKFAIVDEVDVFVERLVRKVEVVEKFVNGLVVGVFFFLKFGVIKFVECVVEVVEFVEVIVV